MLAIFCAALSAVGLYFSTGLGGTVTTSPGFWWAVALISPIPVLWYAFHPKSSGIGAFLCTFAAVLGGTANIIPAYGSVLPPMVLVLAIGTPALGFAIAATGGRFVARRLAPVSGVIAFAALWTGMDYLLSQGPNGAASSPAYSQLEMPAMVQGASVFGLWAITAVMGLFAGAAAMALARRKWVFLIFAVAVLTLNIGAGELRIARAGQTGVVHVGLAGDDSLVGDGLKAKEASALKVAKAYADAAKSLSKNDLIVIPEKILVLDPAWRAEVNAVFAGAIQGSHAMLVAGFDERGVSRQNNAYLYLPAGGEPQSYTKRHLVPGLEDAFAVGNKSFMLSDRTGVAICKDMDFPQMLRQDAMVGPNLYAVPAWDFDRDAVWHARLAILRGVENGFAVARAANDGLLTLSDAYGRVVAVKATAEGGMVTLEGDLARGPGATLYGVIGDGLAYIALAMAGLLLVVAGFSTRRRERL